MEEYHKIIDEFLKVYENLLHDINRNAAIKDNVKNEEFIKLIRYIHLIVAVAGFHYGHASLLNGIS